MDQINIEDISLSLLIGIDMDEEGNLVFTSSSPVFNSEAKEKEETATVLADTLRQSRDKLDATITALTSRGKVQVFLISKSVMKHKGWYSLLDSMYRDGKNTVMSRIVLVDGSVDSIAKFRPTDKPRLPLYLAKLLDTAHERNITVITSIQELHRQFTEKGLTPSLSEVKREDEIVVTGTALLDRTGQYKLSIDAGETSLLRLLQHQTDGEFMFTIRLPQQSEDGFLNSDRMSFMAEGISVKTKTSYKNDRFQFDIHVGMRISIKERLFPYDVKYKAPALEKEIENELQEQFAQLVDKIQKAKIDPIGLGLYARAYEYSHWRDAANQWGEALSRANVKVKVNIKVQAMGSIK